MDRLVDHLFIFEGQGVIRDFPGNYSQYRLWLKEQQAAGNTLPITGTFKNSNDVPPAKTNQQPEVKTKRQLSFKEKEILNQWEKKLLP